MTEPLPTARCPSEEHLAALNRGRLPPDEIDRLAAHLDNCPDCQGRLQALSAGAASLVGQIRQELEQTPANDNAETVSYASQKDSATEVPPLPADPDRTTDQFIAPESAEAPPPAVNGYEILGTLGRGGMGVVYRARQLKLNRLVALKMIVSAEHATVEQRVRFLTEAEAVASLQHPNIVQIYEIGEQGGRPFIAFEYLDGGSLADRLKEHPGRLEQPECSAALIETLARAVFAAHQQGIIHRDLKPANVLFASVVRGQSSVAQSAVASESSNGPRTTDHGLVKISDFGLAKRLRGHAGLTQTGAIVGTPRYMSPEQARGETSGIDVRTDIYGLGVMLYELLMGRTPFGSDEISNVLLKIATEEPPALRRIKPAIPRDLETICLKCLEKERDRRYATALELADDLQRFREGRPITARPAPWLERAWKWMRRYPAAAAFLFVGSLGAAAFVTTILIYNANLHAALNRAESSEKNLTVALGNEKSARKEAKTKARLYKEQLNQKVHSSYAMQLTAAAMYKDNDPLLSVRLLDDTEFCPPRMRDFLWRYYRGTCKLDYRAYDTGTRCMVLSPDGTILATGGAKAGVQLWDFHKGKLLGVLSNKGKTTHCLAFSPDGNRLAEGDGTGMVRVWNVPKRKLINEWQTYHKGIVTSIAFSPDGRRITSGGMDTVVRFWDAASGEQLRLVFELCDAWTAVAYLPDGKTLLSGSTDCAVQFWDTKTYKRIAKIKNHERQIGGLAVSPDGKSFVSFDLAGLYESPGELVMWDAQSRKVRWRFQDPSFFIQAAAFSPDGRILLLGNAGGYVRLLDANTGSEKFRMRLRDRYANAFTFSRDGRFVVASHAAVTSWDLHRRFANSVIEIKKTESLAFAPGKRLLAANGKLLSLDAETTKPTNGPAREFKWISAIVVHPDSGLIAIAEAGAKAGGKIVLWDDKANKERFTLSGVKGRIRSLAFSPDGNYLASGSMHGPTVLWDLQTKSMRWQYSETGDSTNAVAISSDGQLLLSAGGVRGKKGRLTVLNVETGEPAQPISPGRGWKQTFLCAAISSDGRRLAAGDADGAVWLWELPSLTLIKELRQHTRQVETVAFSPDSRTLASGGEDRVIYFWDAETGHQRGAFTDVTDWLQDLKFSPDGSILAAAGKNRIYLWRAPAP